MNVILTTAEPTNLILKSPFAVLLNLEQDTRGWTTTIRPNFVPKLSRLLKGMCRSIPTRERTVSQTVTLCGETKVCRRLNTVKKLHTVAVNIEMVSGAVRITTMKDVIRKFRNDGRKVITIRRNMMWIDFEPVNR